MPNACSAVTYDLSSASCAVAQRLKPSRRRSGVPQRDVVRASSNGAVADAGNGARSRTVWKHCLDARREVSFLTSVERCPQLPPCPILSRVGHDTAEIDTRLAQDTLPPCRGESDCISSNGREASSCVEAFLDERL